MRGRTICDGCGQDVPDSGSYALPPEGWTLLRHGNQLYDLCSQECLVDVVKRLPRGGS